MNGADEFVEFVARRQQALLRLAHGLTGDRQLGEDLLQTALAKMWPRWRSLRRTDAAGAYLRRTLVTTYLTWCRRGRLPTVGEAALADLPSRQDVAADVEARDEVERWLALLPPRQRAVIVLRFLHDLDVASTARALGCDPGTVKSQTSKALSTLRAARGADRTAVEDGDP